MAQIISRDNHHIWTGWVNKFGLPKVQYFVVLGTCRTSYYVVRVIHVGANGETQTDFPTFLQSQLIGNRSHNCLRSTLLMRSMSYVVVGLPPPRGDGFFFYHAAATTI